MSPHLIEERCPRCRKKLSSVNKNPDRLCGYCQRELNPHHKSPAYVQWVAAGKPQVKGRRPKEPEQPQLPLTPPQTEAPKSPELPDVKTLPFDYLRDCVVEMRHRFSHVLGQNEGKKVVVVIPGDERVTIDVVD